MAMIDEIKEQTRKMKEMTPKQKWEYFWGYYKFHVLFIAVILFFLVTLTRDILKSKETVFYTAMINANTDSVTEEVLAEWNGELEEIFGVNTKKEEVCFDTGYNMSNDRSSQFDYTTMQKLMVMAGSQSLDAMIANTGVFEFYAQASFFTPLEQLLTPEQYERLEPYFYYTDYATMSDDDANLEMEEQEALEAAKKAAVIDHHDPSTMEKPVAVGLFIEGSQKLTQSGAYALLADSGQTYQGYPENGVVGIAAGTRYADYALQYIDYFFE